jgi:hypothetical protein
MRRSPRFGGFHMETFAEGYEACTLASGGTGIDYHADPAGFARSAYFRMDGKALYRVTAAALPGFLDRLLGQAGLRREDIDLVVPHQASPHALAHIIRRGGFAPERVFDRVRTIGNQVAASIPVALNLPRRKAGCDPACAAADRYVSRRLARRRNPGDLSFGTHRDHGRNRVSGRRTLPAPSGGRRARSGAGTGP